MELADLKNIDAKELLSKLKSSGIFQDKKALAKFAIGFVAVILSLIIYYSFVSPIVNKQENDIAQMQENKLQIEDLKMQISNLDIQMKEIEPEFKKNSGLFHSKKEVEDLYQSISNFALANGLSIVNISKDDPKAVRGEVPGADPMGDQQFDQDGNPIMMDENMDPAMDPNMGLIEEGEESGSILYYTIPVNYEIRGTFLGYLKFRRALSKSTKVVNFDKEEINLLKEPQGQVLSKGTISIVGLPDEFN